MKIGTILIWVALLVAGIFLRISFNELNEINNALDEITIEMKQMKEDLSQLRQLAAETRKMADELRLELKKALESNEALKTELEASRKKNNDQALIASLKPGESVRLDDSHLAYKVKSGDCLSRLTERFTGCGQRACWEREWQRLKNDLPNFTNPHLIYPGQVFIFGATP